MCNTYGTTHESCKLYTRNQIIKLLVHETINTIFHVFNKTELQLTVTILASVSSMISNIRETSVLLK